MNERVPNEDSAGVREITVDFFEVTGPGRVAGYIHKTERGYRALRGTDPHDAVEHGRFSTWNGALLTVKAG